MTNSRNAINMASQKIIILLINILFVVSLFSTIYPLNYMYREGLLILIFLTILVMKMATKKPVKRSSVLIIIMASLALMFGFTGNVSETFITARSVVLYPLLCLVGGSLEDKKFNAKSLSISYIICAIALAIFGTIEFFSPTVFERILAVLRIAYDQDNLLRGGLGYGLGSLFVSRQYFSTFLCIGIVLILNMKHFTDSRFLTNKVVQWGIASWFLVLIGLTLSRTIIVAALTVVSFNLIKELSIRKALPMIISVLVLVIFVYRIPIVHNSIISAFESLDAMDITMSGRTDIWKGYFENTISIFPQFIVLGNTEHAKFIGVADSVYIRFLVAYGYMLSLIIILFLSLRLLRVIRRRAIDKRLFYSIVLFFVVASVAIDISFMFMIVVPVYIFIGCEYCRIVNKR